MRRGPGEFLTITGAMALAAVVLFFSIRGYLEVLEMPASFVRGTSENKASNVSLVSSKAKKEESNESKQNSSDPLTANENNTNYGYAAHVFTDAQGKSLHFYLYIPDDYNPQQKYPLVLLLEGGGERSKPGYTAAQNQKLLMKQKYVQVWSADYDAPGNPDIQQNWPCFVVIPQILLSQQWVNTQVHKGSYTQTAQPSSALLLTKELLDALLQEYNGIDAHRLYVTGLSNGGYGTWDAIERWPYYFAAAAPIAGAGDPSKAAVLGKMPIWAFHGSADTTVPVSGSRDMIAAIRAAGGHPQYTEFPGAGHSVWRYAYSLSDSSERITDFFPWLFSQRKYSGHFS
jgi:predicted peptidase